MLFKVIHNLKIRKLLLHIISAFMPCKNIKTGIFLFCLIGLLFVEYYIENETQKRPLIIAHRGSCGMLPEHTVAAYELAIKQGADIIECDVGITKDMQLICSHDAGLNSTTDVHSRPEFRDRIRTHVIDDETLTDYFVNYFTLEELKTIRKIQARPYRDQSYNGKFPIATFDEYVAVAKSGKNRHFIAIYPETKNPEYYNKFLLNTTMEDLLLISLLKHGYVEPTLTCYVQSFSEDSLRYMSSYTKLPLIYLTKKALNDSRMKELSTFIYGLGPDKNLIVNVDPTTNYISRKTDFISKAHSLGLKVHPYVMRNEYMFLAWDYGSDPYREYEMFINLNVDGMFTDFSWSLSNYLDWKFPR